MIGRSPQGVGDRGSMRPYPLTGCGLFSVRVSTAKRGEMCTPRTHTGDHSIERARSLNPAGIFVPTTVTGSFLSWRYGGRPVTVETNHSIRGSPASILALSN